MAKANEIGIEPVLEVDAHAVARLHDNVEQLVGRTEAERGGIPSRVDVERLRSALAHRDG